MLGAQPMMQLYCTASMQQPLPVTMAAAGNAAHASRDHLTSRLAGSQDSRAGLPAAALKSHAGMAALAAQVR